MAKRKILVVAGQSNATAIADATSWEDAHPGLRLRSPLVSPPSFAFSITAREAFTIPATFAGGPQIGRFGETTMGTWQNVETTGRVVNAVRFLTHYNPIALGLNTGTSLSATFPGVGEITSFGTDTATNRMTLSTSVFWQYNPSGIVITRERTGSTHTIISTDISQVIEVSPPFFPPPELLERFTYPFVGGATSTTSELRLSNRFGGLSDVGSSGDTGEGLVPGGKHEASLRKVLDSAGAAAVGRISVRPRLGYPGAPVAFNTPTDYLDMVVTAADTGSETISLAANRFLVNDAVRFVNDGLGDLGPNIVFGTTYYVTYSSGLDIRVSDVRGGAPRNITTFAGSIHAAPAFSPVGVTENATYFITRYAEELEEKEIVNAGWISASETIVITNHGLCNGERVQFSIAAGATGSLPTGVAVATDYFVRVVDKDTIEISATRDGAVYAFGPGSGPTGTGTFGSILTRMEAFSHFFISATVGGAEIEITNDIRGAEITFQETFRGSLTGMVITALTGPNAGQSVPAGDVYLESGTNKGIIKLGAPFSIAPGAGDTYSIEPPAVDGDPVSFDKWAYFLPWCPFEGSGSHGAPFPQLLVESAGNQLVTLSANPALPNMVVRFLSSGTVTSKINLGQRYYTPTVSGQLGSLATTYDGTPIVGTASVSPTALVYGVLLHQEGKSNPFPPGFNYPNHYENAVGIYQPYSGPTIAPPPRQTFATGLAVHLAEHFGETVYVVHIAFGGTSIGNNDTVPTLASWAPTGDPNNIYQRFLDELDSAVLALKAQGDTGECVGIVWVQGESDALDEAYADRYLNNLRTLKLSMRQAIKDRGMFAGPVEEIPWIDPRCQTMALWTYAEVINEAKDRLVYSDPFSATFDQEDIERLAELDGPNGLKFIAGSGDTIHYSGRGMTELEVRAYDALLAIPRGSTDGTLEICNMALAHIGVSRKLTTLDDGSTEAEWCKSLYPEARDELLAARKFSFTRRRRAMLEVTKPAGNLYEKFKHCYLVPSDALNAFAVMPPMADGSQTVLVSADYGFDDQPMLDTRMGDIPYEIEETPSGERLLFTDQQDATLRYIAKVVDTRRYSPSFRSALSLFLASKLASAIVRGEQGEALAARLIKRMGSHFGLAVSTDMNQRSAPPTHIPNHLRDR